MPIYEYECQKCGEHFEVNQRISDAPLKKHGGGAKCGGKVVKLMSANTFHLKGTGWYKTDYASSGSSTAASQDKTESSGGKDGKATKKDATVKAEGSKEKSVASKKDKAAAATS